MELPKNKRAFAKKSLGQNFLVDANVRSKILSLAGDLSDKRVLEIGPGLGFLTSHLLRKSASLTAVERDERAYAYLKETFGHKSHFHLIHGDILAFSPQEHFQGAPYVVVANIPYNITNPILRKFLEEVSHKPTFMVLMVQKEVAQKICKPKKASLLSIAVEVFAESTYGFTVSRQAFRPVPKVDSAVIRLDLREKPLIPEAYVKDFFTVLQGGFSQKRKKLKNSLGAYFGVSPALLLGDIDGNRRPETLSVAEWWEMTKNFCRHVKKAPLEKSFEGVKP